MPDVHSIGLGGGSLLRFGSGGGAAEGGPPAAAAGAAGASCTVGPDSVGAELERRSLCCGGNTATASDAAVLLGRMQLGARGAAGAGLTQQQAELAWGSMQRMLEAALDHAKTQAGGHWPGIALGLGHCLLANCRLLGQEQASEQFPFPKPAALCRPAPAGDLPVIVVGGGAPLCGDALAGASAVVRPQHAAVANAVGAAIAQVSGTVDAVYEMPQERRAAVLQQARALAQQRAVAAGAAPDSCWVAEQAEVPLAYLQGCTSRVRIKVIGDLDVASLSSSSSITTARREKEADVLPGQPAAPAQEQQPQGPPAGLAAPAVACWPPLPGRDEEPVPAALAAWQPEVNAAGEWLLHAPDLHLLATGAGILGCGGGGSPGKALLKALMEVQR